MRISDWSSDVCSSDLGGGSNSLALSGSSTLAGNVALGGNGSSLGLSGSAQINGAVDFGGGASTLTLSGTAALNGAIGNADRKSVREGKRVSVRVESGGRRLLKKTAQKY